MLIPGITEGCPYSLQAGRSSHRAAEIEQPCRCNEFSGPFCEKSAKADQQDRQIKKKEDHGETPDHGYCCLGNIIDPGGEVRVYVVKNRCDEVGKDSQREYDQRL